MAAVSALGLIAASVPLAAQTSDLAARATSVTGQALVYSGSSGNAYALSVGFLLSPGDRIDTRSGARVVIGLTDGSMVVIEPQSVIVLKDFRQAASLRELFDILIGKVRVTINHYGARPNPYRMNTPTASVAVRGTEFSIEVGPNGETKVVVYEGAVQVTSLSNPDQSTLIEAGRGVLVQAGQDFHMLGADGNLIANRSSRDRDRRSSLNDSDPPANYYASQGGGGSASQGDRDAGSPRATASAYDSYIASLSDIVQTPFLFRFNAFAEPYLDSLENPAYATQFQTAEARVFLLPTFGGGPDLDDIRATYPAAGLLPGTYSVSPQLSAFGPLGSSNFFVGGSISGSRISDSSVTFLPDEDTVPAASSTLHTAGNSTSSFYSGSLMAARSIGDNSIGFGVELLRGSGSLTSTNTDVDNQTTVEQILVASSISQTRLTAGFSRDLGHNMKLGIFYRYGFISADDHDLSHTINGVPAGLNSTVTGGHSSEIGLRLRGIVRPRLFYGITGGWLGVSLGDNLMRTDVVNSSQLDRAHRGSLGFGLGYILNPSTMFTFDSAASTSLVSAVRTEDATGNPLQNGIANGHLWSTHVAVQRNVWRRFFVSASFLNIWYAQRQHIEAFPDQFGNISLVQDAFFPVSPQAYEFAPRFSDFGVGWRSSSAFLTEYLFTTDYGVTPSTHTIMLRYTFSRRTAN
jgi:hypothetical protein